MKEHVKILKCFLFLPSFNLKTLTFTQIHFCFHEETGLVADKQILLLGLYEETGRVADKPLLLSGLYEETGRVSDKPILLSGLYK